MGRTGWGPLTPGAGPGDRADPDAYAIEPQEGTVLRVTAAGAEVTLPSWPAHASSPAPWPLGSYNTPAAALAAGHGPRPGDRVLVVFAGDDHTPWVIAWWR